MSIDRNSDRWSESVLLKDGRCHISGGGESAGLMVVARRALARCGACSCNGCVLSVRAGVSACAVGAEPASLAVCCGGAGVGGRLHGAVIEGVDSRAGEEA